MTAQRQGSVIGAVFGLIYLLVNTGPLPSGCGHSAARARGVASVAVLIAVYRGRGHGVPRRSGGLGRGYWLVVADEVAALAAGLALLNGPFDPPQAGVAWVSFVVGIHFVALARVTHEPVCH